VLPSCRDRAIPGHAALARDRHLPVPRKTGVGVVGSAAVEESGRCLATSKMELGVPGVHVLPLRMRAHAAPTGVATSEAPVLLVPAMREGSGCEEEGRLARSSHRLREG